MSRCLRAALAILGAVMTTSVAVAQISISSSVIGAGGGYASGPVFAINGTIGQPVIGLTTGSLSSISQGFWYTYASSGISSVDEIAVGSRTSTANGMMQIAPNPVSHSTEIRLQIPDRCQVHLYLSDALGRLVQTIYDGEREAGPYTVRMNTDGMESGHYTAHLVAGNRISAISLIVIK